ncbi:MAG: DUF86 domain-containing protein [Chlorobi bacterium]|nr:DUF86 domain-containing protein [Chlorobiota bacterium]
MTDSIRKSLFDIQTSIESISIHLGDKKDFFQYKNNLTIRRAIERELEIIGEAINRILKEQPNIKIQNSRKIVDLRNFIIHGYDAIDDETIWGVVSKHIPKLEVEINKLLKRNED